MKHPHSLSLLKYRFKLKPQTKRLCDMRIISPKLDRIPAELKHDAAIKWCWWYPQPRRNKPDKIDKIPADDKGRRISTARGEAWLDYKTAEAAYTRKGQGGVGLLLEKASGIVGLDFDDCVQVDKNGKYRFLDKDLPALLAKIGGYQEISPSGTGIRVIGYDFAGLSDFVDNASGVEIYTGDSPRFLTVTGRTLANINGQAVLTLDALEIQARFSKPVLAATPRTPSAPYPDLIDELELPALADYLSPTDANSVLVDFPTGIDRSAELSRITRELLSKGLDDQTVFSILTHGSGSFQVALDHRRGKPTKALTYLWDHHIRKQAKQAEQIVFDVLDEPTDDAEDTQPEASGQSPGVQATNSGPGAPYQGAFPSALAYNNQSLLQTAIDWILDNSARPQPGFALASALSFFSTAIGSSYVGPTGLFVPSYQILVGSTSCGKDYALKAVKTLLTETGLAGRSGPDALASGPGLEDLLIDQPVCCLAIDELGEAVSKYIQNNTNDHGIMRTLLALYSASGSVYTPRAKAKTQLNDQGQPAVIKNPFLSILGTSTPAAMGRAITPENTENGWLGRLEFIATDNQRPAFQQPQRRSVPSAIEDWVSDVLTVQLTQLGPMTVTFGPGAESLFYSFSGVIDRALAGMTDELHRAALVRKAEHAIKKATILAVISDAFNPVITEEMMEWAISYAESVSGFVAGHLAENTGTEEITAPKTDSILRSIQRIIENGATIPKTDKQKSISDAMLKQGVVPRRLLFRRVYRQFKNTKAFDEAIDSLLQAGLLTEVRTTKEKHGSIATGYKIA
jgi:hypothetical protein